MKATIKIINREKPIVQFEVIAEDDFGKMAIMHPGFKPNNKRLYLVEKENLDFINED